MGRSPAVRQDLVCTAAKAEVIDATKSGVEEKPLFAGKDRCIEPTNEDQEGHT